MLRGLLADGATLRSDGGGKVIAFLNPIVGVEKILRLYEGLRRKHQPSDWLQLKPVWVYGLPGYLGLERGEILQTTAFAIENGKITDIFITRNPDKLARAGATLDR